jgi:hypothetical protein
MATLKREKVEAPAEIICGAGGDAAGALLVLTRTLERSLNQRRSGGYPSHLRVVAERDIL